MRCAQSCAERFSALNRKGRYFVLSSLLLFCVLCGVIFKSVLKSIFSIIRLLDLEKKHKHGSTIRVKIIILRPVVQN